ncbi:MAG: hypothetical protein U0638_14145 [Phycisphaerales bacterium]
MAGDPPTNAPGAPGANVPHHGQNAEPPKGESLGRDLHEDSAPRELHEGAFEGEVDERYDAAPPPPYGNPTGVRRAAGLTSGQERAIIALMAEPSIAKAARTANVGERTLHTWLDEPEFARAYRDARRKAFAQAISLTHKMAAAAVQTLAKVMIDTTAPHAARVSAASSLLRFSREAIELDDLAARLEDIEQRLGEGP